MLYSASAGSLQGLAYGYDAKGNVSSLSDARNSNEAINYFYDGLDRLLSASSSLFSESYAYNPIGTFRSKGGVSYSYASGHAHAPSAVGGNAYSYDNNGNLTSAEGRTYGYDAENRLASVVESGTTILSHGYDGDGVLRSVVEPTQTIHYISPDYRFNLTTGEATVYYRFGGRNVGYHNNSGVHYTLTDHLSSIDGEISASQSEQGERRYYPFGGIRPVSGIGDIADEEGFTGQKRLDAGNGNARRELHNSSLPMLSCPPFDGDTVRHALYRDDYCGICLAVVHCQRKIFVERG